MMGGDPRSRAPASATASDEDARRLQGVVRDLWQHGEALLRAELRLGLSLAREELDRGLGRAKLAVRRAALIQGLFTAAYLALIASVTLALGDYVQPWVSLLVASALSGAAGYALATPKEPTRGVALAMEARALPPTHTAPRAQL